MRTALLIAAASVLTGPVARAADYIYSDAFEIRICDGVSCTYCSPIDPQPLCGTHSHCVPYDHAMSMCTYPAGAGTQGNVCSDAAGCAAPYACIQAPSLACRQWCERSTGTCPGTASCFGMVPPAMIGGTEWGICL